jgi:hypothetical protein
MAMRKGFDPFSCVPSSTALRERLGEIQEQARRLRVLLRTAMQIEQDGRKSAEAVDVGRRPQEPPIADTPSTTTPERSPGL